MKFRSDPTSIRGAITATLTPFAADGSLDTSSLRKLVTWQLDAGSHGISIGGSTGEPSAQSAAERIEAMRVVAEVTGDACPFLAGTGSTKLDETLSLTQAAVDLGADAALVVTPYYAIPTQAGLRSWYGAVASEFPSMPIVIYNVPSRTSVSIDPETVARLRADHDNIVGIKETTRDFEHFSRVIHACGRDFLVWSGIEQLCLPLLSLGGVGFVSALSNLAPGGVARLYDLWSSGTTAGAADQHFALLPLADLLFVETNPAPAKWTLEQRGIIDSGFVRPPLVPLTPEGQDRAAKYLAAAEDVLRLEPAAPRPGP
ncbi:MAG: 4-hydroxy-tetrahydrodipicolinate synthase [Acidimicrobiales bacterium]